MSSVADVRALGILSEAVEPFAALDAVLNSSPVPMQVLDRDGIVRIWNPASERVLGWTADEVIGHLHPAIPEDEAAAYQEQLDRALGGEVLVGMDGKRRTRDGIILTIRLAAAPLRDHVGNIVGVVRTFEDISAQRQAEEVVRSQAALIDLTSDAILVRDFDTDEIRLWNRGAEALYGYTREETIGRVSHELLWTAQPISIQETKRILVETGRWEGELIHRTRAGRELIVASRWAMEWAGGKPSIIFETNTDITERKHAEEALIRSEEKFRTIVETAHEGVWVIDATMRTILANDRMAEMLGCTPAELAGRTVVDFLFPEDEPISRDRIRGNLEGRVEQFDFRFRRMDGTEVLVLGCTSPMHDEHGEIVGALGMFTDITRRMRLEQERAELANQKDAFLSAAAHDLKNPIAVLQGQAQLMKRRMRRGSLDEDYLDEGLTRIEERSRLMTQLIDELLDVTRLRMGRGLELRYRRVDLVDLVRRCVVAQQDVSPDHRLTVEPSDGSVVGQWDAARLTRVLGNLLSNAIKYSPAGSETVVGIHQEAGWAVLTVRDQGIGIETDDLPKIFDWFYRGGNVAAVSGTGIGLAGARRIVEQHGGSIDVESRPRIGTTFTVRLPLEPLPEEVT